MLENLANFFDSSGFMPHGHCFFWTPSLLWIYVVSDFIIATSYFSIPFALWYFVRKRPDVPFPWIFLMFGAFVLACGTTHLFAIWNIWHADYWADAGLKALTATVSAATAILLWPLIPKALTIPSHLQLENANRELRNEVMRREQAESALLVANEALERRVAERTADLRARELRYQAVVTSAPNAFVTSDAAGRIVGWNPSAERIFGYAETEVIGQPLTLLIPQRLQDRHLDGMKRVQSGGERRAIGKTVELVGRRKDASEFPLELSLSEWSVGEGRFFNGIIRDITERKRADDALRAAEDQFRGLVEQSISGIYIIQDDKLAYINPHFAEILGYASVDELIGRDPLSIVAEKDRGMVTEKIRLRLEGNAPSVSYGFTAVRKDGAMIEVGAHGARATHNGRPAIIGLLQDISDEKRTEEEIRRYVAQIETAFMSTVRVVTTLGELRDPYTAGHQRKVAEIAAAIGAELGFDAHRQEGLRVAGYLHDIGKITIPSEILSKPGKLSPIQFQLVRGHAQASYEVLKGVEFPWPVVEVALQHHERLDGSGYPQGLKGEAILLEARIMAVADVVEAMSSHRPYRPGLGIEAAQAEIERGRGTVYDPVVADACVKLFQEKGYTIPV
jgi:PAS domain S-box-containing protein/putative nucleotidyltransferase with HDIG domain